MERPLNPILSELLASPKITDLCFNRHDEIYLDQGRGFERLPLTSLIFHSENDYRNFILDEISKSGKVWDAKLPFLDTVFFGTHRAHVAFPPLSQHGISLSLRRLPQRSKLSTHEAQLKAAERWNNSSVGFALLVEAIEKKESIIFAGATGSGKTTLLNDLVAFIPAHERIITLEDTAELCPQHEHWLSLLSRTANADGFGEVKLRDLVKQTLRMKPDRILVGECRGDEVIDLLQALNTGHRGTLSTLHANSAKEAIKRLELLAMIAARGTIPSTLMRELIANGIQKIAFLSERKIESILQIEGFERDLIFSRVKYSSELTTS
jgi:pilus assembly protein CpaF